MQFMPHVPEAILDGVQDPEYDRLVPQGKAAVEQAIADGMDPAKQFRISVEDGVASVQSVDFEWPGDRGSLDEINALLGDPLPEMYTREGVSQAEEPIWADHLSAHWGF